MQKSLLIALIITVIGAVAIHQFGTALPAYAAFVLGAVLVAIALTVVSNQPSSASNAKYSGPTKTLYVGNLPYRVHENEVKALFAKFGPVNSVRLVRDRKTGRRKGFGFVEMSDTGADKALDKLNDYTFQERTLKVREARTQESSGDRD
ncbi:RNA recognition motif domain-containing protein [Parashewanella tropica]|uniref:RNA recognition motif domain-containing protein n=1 Tax=Parashewanella tropica TaxID=2547970 RepID=UPI001059614D|nr:RNA-binding protein [Parashewanella tropica]